MKISIDDLLSDLNHFVTELMVLDNLNSIEASGQYKKLLGEIRKFNQTFYPSKKLVPIKSGIIVARNPKIHAQNIENRYHANVYHIISTLEEEIITLEENGLPQHLKGIKKTKPSTTSANGIGRIWKLFSNISIKILIQTIAGLMVLIIFALIGTQIISYIRSQG